MNVKSIAGQLGERRARFALSSHSAGPLAGHWSVSDFAALTKPRVMILAVFTALVGLSSAPNRLDPLTTFAAVLAIAAGAGAAGVLNMAVLRPTHDRFSRSSSKLAVLPTPEGVKADFVQLQDKLSIPCRAIPHAGCASSRTGTAQVAFSIAVRFEQTKVDTERRITRSFPI
jgi:protoheme IX farnesyltransferase